MIESETELEVWSTYPEFEWIKGSNLGRYKTIDRKVIDTLGRKRTIKGHILRPHIGTGGYLQLTFGVNGKVVCRKAHRVTASCFLPNPLGLEEVNHINGCRTDNRVENLEWCSRSYNQEYRNKCGVSHKEAAQAQTKPLIAINLATLEVRWLPSQMEAGRQLRVNQGNISSVIKYQHGRACNYWFVKADNNAVKSARDSFGDLVARKVEKLMEVE